MHKRGDQKPQFTATHITLTNEESDNVTCSPQILTYKSLWTIDGEEFIRKKPKQFK